MPVRPKLPACDVRTREIARGFIIEQGAGYFKGVCKQAGTTDFDKLPKTVLEQVCQEAELSAQDSGFPVEEFIGKF